MPKPPPLHVEPLDDDAVIEALASIIANAAVRRRQHTHTNPQARTPPPDTGACCKPVRKELDELNPKSAR
jgi:hypothetical protein